MNTPYTAPEWSEPDPEREMRMILAAQADPEPIQTLCVECNRPTASDEGICYECQCAYHQMGLFDMDGRGWR